LGRPLSTNHTATARQRAVPRNHLARESVGIPGAVEALVVAADRLADLGTGVDVGGEGLAVDWVVADRETLRLGESFRMIAEVAQDIAMHADQAEVAQPCGGAQCVTLGVGEPGGLGHASGDFDHGLGLAREVGVKRVEDAAAEVERVLVAGLQLTVGRVEGRALKLQVLHLGGEGGVGEAQLLVEPTRLAAQSFVFLDQLVA
jgi:hypothetical protein